MKRVKLVTGEPKSGKTWLAEKLANDHSFINLSVDAVYVDFVKSKCHMLFFEALNKYISPHYNCILSDSDYSKTQFEGRDFVKEWREYLLQRIEERLADKNDQIVVEGYLLKYCMGYLQEKLQGKAQTFQIQVANRVYKWKDQTFTVEQVASLGNDTSPGA